MWDVISILLSFVVGGLVGGAGVAYFIRKKLNAMQTDPKQIQAIAKSMGMNLNPKQLNTAARQMQSMNKKKKKK